MSKKKPDKMMDASFHDAVSSPASAKSPAASKHQTPIKTSFYANDLPWTPKSTETSAAAPLSRKTTGSAYSQPTSDTGRPSFSTPPTGVDSYHRCPACTRKNAPSEITDSCEDCRLSQDSKDAGHSKFKAKVKGLFSKKSSKSLFADARNAATTADIPPMPPMPGQIVSGNTYQEDWKLSPQQGRTSCYYRPDTSVATPSKTNRLPNLAEGQALDQTPPPKATRGVAYIFLPPNMKRSHRPPEVTAEWRPARWDIVQESPGQWSLERTKPAYDDGRKLPLIQPEEYRVPEPARPKFEKPPHTAWALKSKLAYKYHRGLDRAEPVWKAEPELGNARKVAMNAFLMTDFALERHYVKVYPGGDDSWMRSYIVRAFHVDTNAYREWRICCALPHFPKYKLKSVVATMMYVKESTNIPVPAVVCHDVNLNNPLGMEYMMVESGGGRPYAMVERELSFEAKKTFARGVADCVDQLSNLAFSDIGSLYRDFTKPDGDFNSYFVDICTEPHLTRDMRVDYAVPRGPYRNLYDFYTAQIAVLNIEAKDRRQKERLKHWFPSQAEPKKTEENGTMKDLVQKKLKSSDPKEDGPWEFLPPPTYTFDDLQLLPTFCDAFQSILYLLTSSKEVVPGQTRLGHFNLSKDNILVNERGEITGILDWENAWVAPPELIPKYPACLPNLNEENPEPMLDFASDDGDSDKEDKWEDMMLAMEYEDRLKELNSAHLEVLYKHRDPQLVKMEEFLRKVPSMETFMEFLDDVDRSRKGAKEEETWL
ncbi:uncharacterized protein J3D65DRAFT_680778 [Phyllosticta citribraziliensis]|uniref:Aminoglycoside phosphotransferase domain-containing protein n=1 Tax=Phyllosticta citribraziliensis TaxID=989973 RepID=A0ABR1L600_9PEZI